MMTGINCSSRSAAWGKKNYPYGSVHRAAARFSFLKIPRQKGNKAMITVYPASKSRHAAWFRALQAAGVPLVASAGDLSTRPPLL
jgi:hypothetical protein